MRLPVPRLLLLLTCACVALVVPSSALAATKYPTISKVSPKKLGIGDVITITGKNFRKGKNKNVVVFKRDGGRAVFVTSTTATTKKISLTVPAKLLPFLLQKKGSPVSTRFRVRVLAKKFGKTFTSKALSPMIGPKAIGGGTKNDCDGDGRLNATDTDDDNDLISDVVEAQIGTDGCKRDTDGDGMSDGWEYTSGLDRNAKALPSPRAKPYPNPLDKTDGGLDQDGDALTNAEEYAAWSTFGNNKLPLSYSGGNPTSAGRAQIAASQSYLDRDDNGYLSDNERDADGDGLSNQDEGDLTRPVQQDLVGFFDTDYIGLPEVKTIINEVPLYGALDYTAKADPTDWLARDTDGDGVVDGADDQDHDDVPNLDELKLELAAPADDKTQRALNACVPNLDSRACFLFRLDADHDGIPNGEDPDDDNDFLSDSLERSLGLRPDKADTDGDGVEDGFEYESAIDLNNRAVPFPGKRAYPNALDPDDLGQDFDQDGLDLIDEYRAWKHSGRPIPMNYSDGLKYTGGKTSVSGVADLDGNGFRSDDEKDVDGDGLTNWDELYGRMTQEWWVAIFNGSIQPLESRYPGPTYLDPQFDDADTDGDGLNDGADDQDHDGYTNLFEVSRPGNWASTYISTTHSGSNPLARVQPFNPCKPIYSDQCHGHPPASYYAPGEDWASPYEPGDPGT